MSCDEKDRLTNLYRAGVAHYATTVNELGMKRSKAPKADYVTLFAQSQDAKNASETARQALERHTQEHGC